MVFVFGLQIFERFAIVKIETDERDIDAISMTIYLNTAEAKPILGGAKLDTKRSEVADVGSRVSIIHP